MLTPDVRAYLRDHADEANPSYWIPRLLDEIERLMRVRELIREEMMEALAAEAIRRARFECDRAIEEARMAAELPR